MRSLPSWEGKTDTRSTTPEAGLKLLAKTGETRVRGQAAEAKHGDAKARAGLNKTGSRLGAD